VGSNVDSGCRPVLLLNALTDFTSGTTKTVTGVREAAPFGELGALKTKRSARDLKITEPVASLLKKYRKSLITPAKGLLFTSNGVDPINHNSFAKYYIKPHAVKVCTRWNGCYSGRHGAATTLYNQDGDVTAAYQVLANSLEIVMATYVKPDGEQGKAGQVKYEQTLSKAMKKKPKSIE
jgi:hypothetical protein